MTEQENHIADVDAAAERMGHRLVRQGRARTVRAVLLVLAGGYLLYSGLSSAEHLWTTFGAIFILYGLWMRFHVRRTQTIVAELRDDIARQKKDGKDS